MKAMKQGLHSLSVFVLLTRRWPLQSRSGMQQGTEDALSDAETLAGRELGERAAKLRRRILLPHLIVGATLGIVGYVILREAQLRSFGMHMPYVTGGVSFAPCFLGSGWLGRRAADAAVRLKMRGWCDELITRHRLSAGTLDDYAAFL
jgi:hypothetical protein